MVKIRNENQDITIIYIPAADRPIRKSRLSRALFHSIIMTMVLVFITLIAGQIHVYLNSSQRIALLNHHLKTERAQYEELLTHKEDTIAHLQLNVFELTQTAEDIEAQMQELKMLESEIRKLSTEVEIHLDESIPLTPIPDASGGPFHPIQENQFLDWMGETKSTFVKLEFEINHLSDLLSNAKALLKKMDVIHRHTPSIWPASSTVISSGFGIRKDPFSQRLTFHSGIDISGSRNDQIFATADGTVETAGWDAVQGNFILIDHNHELQTLYMHLYKINVNQGDIVKKGESIGRMGSTGRSTGNHLHYEVLKNSQPVNPMLYIEK